MSDYLKCEECGARYVLTGDGETLRAGGEVLPNGNIGRKSFLATCPNGHGKLRQISLTEAEHIRGKLPKTLSARKLDRTPDMFAAQSGGDPEGELRGRAG